MVAYGWEEKRLHNVFREQPQERTEEMQNLMFGAHQPKPASFQDLIQRKMMEQQAKIVADTLKDVWESWSNLEELYELLSDPSIRPLLASIERSELEMPKPAAGAQPATTKRTRSSREDIDRFASAIWTHIHNKLMEAEKPLSIKDLLKGLDEGIATQWDNQSVKAKLKKQMDEAGVIKDASKGPAYTMYSMAKKKK